MVGEYETCVACGMIEEPRCVRLMKTEGDDIEADGTKLRLGEREAMKVRRTGWQ